MVRLATSSGLGNRMFQCLFAYRLAEEFGVPVTGDSLPEWGLVHEDSTVPLPSVYLQGHMPNPAGLRRLWRLGLLQGIETNALACRLELMPSRAAAQALFRDQGVEPLRFPHDRLVINVRAAEILGARHKDYRPLPLAFYERVIRETRRRPVFVGQIGDDPYSQALRARFPEAEFHPSRGVMEDFATLRAANHLVMAVSTFSWLACWLSEARTIHMPLTGFFHPKRRKDVDLFPPDDYRYSFHAFPPDAWTGTEEQMQETIAGAEAGRRISHRHLLTLVHGIKTPDPVPRVAPAVVSLPTIA
ncbi:hypothetical protein BKE38_00530 [Pseudoroseomonas deserti]|uniref:Glycosyl transferase n=1 Tax=Teichococcus deserti TaxID=1817963 RepID=A0A1V2H8F5_9PROT|nr:hypothetical protein BKE38_00530 [Pseudoroseomonas deserti]